MKQYIMIIVVAGIILAAVGVWGFIDPEDAPFDTGEWFTTITCPDVNYARLEWDLHMPGFWAEPSITLSGHSWVDKQVYVGDSSAFDFLWWHDFEGRVTITYNETSRTYVYNLGSYYTGIGACENTHIICDTMVNDQNILECMTKWTYKDDPIQWELSIVDVTQGDQIPQYVATGYTYME